MLEIFLNITSFSISVGGLVAVFVVTGDKKKEIVFGVIVAALIAIGGTTLYSSYQHQHYVDCVQAEVIKILSPEAITFDDLYQKIYPPVPHELLREALYDGIEKGVIGYRPMCFQSNGKIMSVKVFYRR